MEAQISLLVRFSSSIYMLSFRYPEQVCKTEELKIILESNLVEFSKIVSYVTSQIGRLLNLEESVNAIECIKNVFLVFICSKFLILPN